MRKYNYVKKFCVILIAALFLGICTNSIVYSYKISYNKCLYLPHSPIYINGNDDFTSENGVTGGSGSYIDPYIIEGWEIDASSMVGITIRNASVYFEIKNCYIHEGGINNDGVVFINVTNGTIKNSLITGNRNGIMFCTQFPGKENSEHNKIHNNSIISNFNDGINFEHTGWGYHSDNIISKNNLSNNKRGIYMIMSAENLIFYNNIIENTEIGILLDMCIGGGENNKIHHNNFIYNGDENGQAYERGGPKNIWDDGYPSGGNYWSDYNGTDNDGDGIGDTPYPIPGGNNKDRYPLMNPWSGLNQPPNTPNIDGPKKGKTGIKYTFMAMSNDPDMDNISYFFDWGDDNNSGWTEYITSGNYINQTHTWEKKDKYIIRVKAKDFFGAESNWGTFELNIPKNNPFFLNFNLFSLLFERFSNSFLILRHLLGL